ncbi:hypothetical protein Bcav_0175 [Beutenbergia cavernae DSM 12333]|uniref:Uncharacterized protein n=1 Tax=Beutenbergia cavernae (strain ATCC BAA-8 / DSM 12333 / CCUG 43141 / JCM 11478 / NBRC 16432 / NCIMB 13614 / HKI 0122) TaxID=471853 RepID=C5BVK0_BEUC1|nr:hypothetical protein [Beutenbergia cavernae]ACQ78440.1 hypothetical protein Bcav_0175 [Beutenbergia cavernae DSM 12333]
MARGTWTQLWRLLKRYGPLALAAWRQVDKYLKEHPDVSAASKQQILRWRDQVIAVKNRRSVEGRLRGTLEVVDRLAAEHASSGRPERVATARDWADRAADITRALDMAVTRTGTQKKLMLDRIAARTDALAAEAFESLVDDDGGPPVEIPPRRP